jgi:hypothetical protein
MNREKEKTLANTSTKVQSDNDILIRKYAKRDLKVIQYMANKKYLGMYKVTCQDS